jgi:hypothetical protein
MATGERAVEHIHHLAVDIGPRPTGSNAEAEALAYAENFFQAQGFSTERFPVEDIRPHRKVSWLGLGIFTALLAGVLIIDIFPLFLLATLLVIRLLVMPYRLRRAAKPVPGGLQSFNVIAEQKASQASKATLVLGAHIDTAVARPFHKTGWRKWGRRLLGMKGVGRGFLALLAIFLLQFPAEWLLGDTSETVILAALWVVKVYFVLVWLWLVFNSIERLNKPVQFAPGANDNGSGVGVVLALAEYYAKNPPAHVNLRYMVFCAEEVGLVGSARYAKQLSEEEKANLYMLNFDMVGTGEDVRYVRSRTHKQLNAWLVEGGVKPGGFISLGSSDFRSFLKEKVPASGLFNMGNKIIFEVYHSSEDVMDYIDPTALANALHGARTMVQRLDESLGAVYPAEEKEEAATAPVSA